MYVAKTTDYPLKVGAENVWSEIKQHKGPGCTLKHPGFAYVVHSSM